eukprot:scaffold771_cov147-Skeletonema_menzelii.AAC.9
MPAYKSSRMPGLLRQRHTHHSNNERQNSELNDTHFTTTTYNPKSKSADRGLALWPLLLIGVGVVFLCSRANSAASEHSHNLKLITVYPWPIAATIHNIEGQTELLISNDNRKAVEAVRTTIKMANSLRRRKRHKSLLLKFTNFIASLGSQDSNKSNNGDVELESYGEAKIRKYLLEHGEKCSGDNGDAIVHRYVELIDSIVSAGDDNERINSIWAYAVNLFTWCQFANEDARGYVTHGTFLKTHQILEESRLTGVGIIGGDTPATDGMHYSQLFVIPSQTNDSSISRDLMTEMLHTYLTEFPFPASPQKLLFGVHDRVLEQWTTEPWLHTDGNLDGDWLLLK